jgi:Tfp pilus assembly protein PilN
MKLRLNLATKPLENKRPFLALTGTMGAVGILLFFLLSHGAYKAWRANRDLRAEIARSETQISASKQRQAELQAYFRSPQAQQVLDRAAFLNSLIGERSFPWTKIFMDLERTLPAGVRVVNIAPSLKNGKAVVQITVGAANDESKIKFLETLEKSQAFSNVQVQEERHSEQPTSASDKIVLQLTAWYQTT